jgi:stage II sporulation SpoAA-like protein
LSVEIAVEPDLIRVTFAGVLTGKDLADVASAADEIERGRDPVPNRLGDLTTVTEMQVAYPDVKVFAEQRRKLVFPNTFRTAIVVRTPVQMGIARMFQTLNDNPQITIQIFEDETAALDWLRGGTPHPTGSSSALSPPTAG